MAGSVPPPVSATLPTQSPITATPAARAFFGRLYDGVRSGLSQRRPWLELVDRNQLAKPDSLAEATARVRKNWTYFRVNYLILLSTVLTISLVSHPVSLFVLILLLSGWLFLYLFRSEPLVLFNRTFSDREVLGIMILLTIIVVFLTSVGSLIISALMFGLAIVCAHAAFRVPEDLFLDEQESAGGFLSFLGGVPNPASVVAARV
ncbi:PRA1 family protein B4 [Nymphaea colorata]|uniref:PRA1 family protein B4 n=1 Tax=Nymphaea colorata TaxID=210225 RepID=UPI00129E083E|nr:PRA1 family protein B4 [Nymphaea colorata]